jgi:SAM-dependent methyltransferase
MLARNDCTPRRIVDIGCGTGGVLSAVLDNLPAATEGIGYDIAPYPVSIGKKRQRENFSVECADFLASDEKDFDLLLCIDVFEHVEDYIGFLRKARGRAKTFIFHIPLDMDIKGLLRKRHMRERKEVGHIHHFDCMTALSALEDVGYNIVDYFYTTKADNGLKARLISAARRLVQLVTNENFAVQLLGGSSLMVLATPDGQA